jgi:hypothetical protein
LADQALLVLGEICSVSLIFLQSQNWEVIQDDELLYHCLETDKFQKAPPSLFDGNYCHF